VLAADEQEACEILRGMSRAWRVGTDDVARWLVAEHARAVADIGDVAPATARRQPSVRSRAASRAHPQKAQGAHTGPRGSRVRTSAQAVPRQSPRTARAEFSHRLARLGAQGASLRRRLAASATLLAQTEARLADTFDQSAKTLPEHGARLGSLASAAREYSVTVGELAREFSQDHGYRRRGPVIAQGAAEDTE
jgi:hypothetical protein